jgi:hypothetical protein
MRLGHGIAVVVEQDHRIGQEQGAIEIGGLADHRQRIQFAPLNDLARGMEVDVGELRQGDQEGGPTARTVARAEEARQHLGRELPGGPELVHIG